MCQLCGNSMPTLWQLVILPISISAWHFVDYLYGILLIILLFICLAFCIALCVKVVSEKLHKMSEKCHLQLGAQGTKGGKETKLSLKKTEGGNHLMGGTRRPEMPRRGKLTRQK